MSQYDLFISYCRGDNENQHITELKEQIEADYLQFSGEELRCFFDLDDIRGMEDWRHRILGGLRESNILLLILSPGYLASDYCEWEIVEYLKYEHSRPAAGEGIAPVYFVEVPGLESPDFEKKAAAWVARVRRRHHFDLRPWYDEGAEALRREDVRTRMEALKQTLHARISKMRRITEAPGNFAGHNPYFVGRETEMLRVHEAAGLGRSGSLTVLQGVAGLGKTSLAIQYAHSYADFYPGGRWIVGCANKSSLAGALRGLDVDLGITPDEEEKSDDIRVARRVLAELERRANEGAAARAKEKNPPQPRALLLLDNVDDPDLLQPPQSNLITGKYWLHVVATTRLPDHDLGHAGTDRLAVLTVDKLSLEDSVRLIEHYQDGGSFPTEEERAAAHDLARLLDGFTLTVEVVAAHLGERRGQLTCAALRDRLQGEGFAGLEQVAQDTRSGLQHRDKLLEATLGPTLEGLSDEETELLHYAARLPPDTIPLPWLRRLVAMNFREFRSQFRERFFLSIRWLRKWNTWDQPLAVREAGPGYDDPWLDMINHLIGLRLLQVASIDPDTRTPLVVRMHRLLGQMLRSKESALMGKENRAVLTALIDKRAWSVIKQEVPPKEWELEALVAAIPPLLNGDKPLPQLARKAAQMSSALRSYRGTASAWQLLQPAHEVLIRLARRNPKDTERQWCLAQSYKEVGDVLSIQWDLSGALRAYRTCLEISERLVRRKPGNATWQSGLAQIQFSLGHVLYNQRDLPAALRCHKQALEIRERLAQQDRSQASRQAAVASSHAAIGGVLSDQGDLPAALRCYKQSLEIRERLAQQDRSQASRQAAVASSHADIGGVLRNQGDLPAALSCFETALGIYKQLSRQDPGNVIWHSGIAWNHSNLGHVLKLQGDHNGALRAYRESLSIRERCVELDPSNTEQREGLAVCNRRVGDVLHVLGDWKSALAAHTRSHEIMSDLLRIDPDNRGWLWELAVSHERIGDAFKNQGDLNGARTSYTASLDIFEHLAKEDESNRRLQRDLSCAFLSAGSVLGAQGDLGGAMRAYQACLDIRERLAKEDESNTEWQSDLALIQSHIGSAFQTRGDSSGAMRAYQSSLAIFKRLVEQDPSDIRWQSNLASAHSCIGSVLQGQGDLPEALCCYKIAADINERLARQGPGNSIFQFNVSRNRRQIGDVLRQQGDLDAALCAFQKCLAIDENLEQRYGDKAYFQSALAWVQGGIGNVLRARGDLAGALRAFHTSLAIRENLAQLDPSNADWQSNLAWSQGSVGDVLLAQGDLDGALRIYQTSLAMRENLARRDPANADWQSDLSWSRGRIGDVLLSRGDAPEALRSYRAALDLWERLVRLSPGNVSWQRDLCGCYAKLGEATASLDITQSREWWGKCHQHLLSMREKGVLLPADEHLLETARREAGL